MKPTSGPYEKRPWGSAGAIAIAQPGKMPHATVFPAKSGGSDYRPTPEEIARADADATLYCAATVLLEAAEEVIARWDLGDLAGAVRNLAQAVAMAKGETP